MRTRVSRIVAASLAASVILVAFAVAEPARAGPAGPTLSLSPSPSGGVVNAMTVAFAVSWAAGWDGSLLSDQFSDTSGHVHFMVDGNPPAMHFAAPGATSITRTFHFALGSHEVLVELVSPDHMPYDPPATASASFEVALTEEGRLILDQVQAISDGLGFLTTLLYGVLALTIIAIIVAAVAVGQVRRLKRVPS